jgi:hypothetical protein
MSTLHETRNATFPLELPSKVTVKVERKIDKETPKAVPVIGEVHDGTKVVVLDSGSTYYLVVRNKYRNRRCDATLEIDGVFRGIFRLRPTETIYIRHPYNDQHSFKIVRQNRAVTREGAVASSIDGLVKLTLEPEWEDLQVLNEDSSEGKGAVFRSLDGPDAGKVKQMKISDDRRLGKSNHAPDKVTRDLGGGNRRAKTVQGDASTQKLEDVEEGMSYSPSERFVVKVPIVVRKNPKKRSSDLTSQMQKKKTKKK